MTDFLQSPAILIIDADPIRAEACKRLLKDLAPVVVTTEVGEKTALLLRERRFAAVIARLDSPAEIADLVSNATGVPVVLLAEDPDVLKAEKIVAAKDLDFLSASAGPDLLRSKAGLLVELARTRQQLEEATRLLEAEKRAGEALKGIIGEQVHRSKNLLAIIQSIAVRTLADGRDIADAREALAGRLRAMARAYQFLTSAGGKGTEISDIIEAGLGDAVHRATTSGPPARLASSVVQTFALAIHELTANAKKHGALGSPDGSIAIGWTFFENGQNRFLEVAWTERGGPPAHQPPQLGFGLALVSSLARSTSPTPSFVFDPLGFSCRMRLSHDMILAG